MKKVECPVGPNGLAQHYFKIVNGVWVCLECGEQREEPSW